MGHILTFSRPFHRREVALEKLLERVNKGSTRRGLLLRRHGPTAALYVGVIAIPPTIAN